jgi:hypothetical protein
MRTWHGGELPLYPICSYDIYTPMAASDDGLDWAAHLETREGVWAARAARHRLAKIFCVRHNG